MNIQAIDGRWYVRPFWCGDNFIIRVEGEELVLKYKGRVLWATARRVLPRLGIKAKLDRVRDDSAIILNAKLERASVFQFSPTRPIPVPQQHEGIWNEAPNPLLHGEVLSWKHYGKRWLPIGVKSSASFAIGAN